MIKVLGCSLVALTLFAAPASAGDCWCVKQYAHTFVSNGPKGTAMKRAYYNSMGAWLWPYRTKIRTKIYDYERTGALDESWCKRHPKLCRALRACLAAGGIVVAQSYTDGKLTVKESAAAGGACGAAAANALLFP